MGTVNVTLGDGKKLNLILGQQLENAVTAVVFDFSAWQTEFGSGTLGLSVQRHGDDQPYAVVPTVSGTNATWNISELDTAYKGVGEVQVTYTVGSVVKKSTVYKFTVYRSLGENGEYPSPGQTWQEEIEDELADVKQDLADLQNDAGVTAELKSALLDIAENIAYINENGQTLYDNLYNALYPNASSITCVYTQTGTVYTTDTLDSLKNDLVVTAHYSDSTTKVLKPSDYTLTGTLTAGTSTIIVHYGNLETSFAVNVTVRTLSSISAVYTQSGTVYTVDDLDSLKSDLVVTATYNDSSTEIVPSTDYEVSGTLSEGTSTITVSYGGKTTTFNVEVSWKYLYALSNGDLEKLNASTAYTPEQGAYIATTSNNTRRSFVINNGERSYRYTTDGVTYDDTSPYYPIPIPPDATRCTVSITPSSQFHGEGFFELSNNEYIRTLDPGWKQGSFTHTFSAGLYEYLSVNGKYNSSSSQYAQEPTELIIEFS